jgi:hypothetical protein
MSTARVSFRAPACRRQRRRDGAPEYRRGPGTGSTRRQLADAGGQLHIFSGNAEQVLGSDGKVRGAVRAAQERGVVLDVGHA